MSENPVRVVWWVFAALLLMAGRASAQSIPIGRSSLTLPEPSRWTVEALPAIQQTLGGDAGGQLQIEGKRMILKSASGSVQAVLISRVSNTVKTNGMVTWNLPCKVPESPLIYQRDRFNANNVDCLKVAPVSSAPDSLAKLGSVKSDSGGNLPEGKTLYFVDFVMSLGTGGIAQTQALISQDFKGREGVAVDNTSRLPTALIAWAEALAKNNRDAIGSLSGNWAIPEMAFGK
jgi:hypothetical protein